MLAYRTVSLVVPAQAPGGDRVGVFEADDGDVLVLVVADGAGGRSGGELAAEFVIAGVGSSVSSLHEAADASALLSRLDANLARLPGAGETTAVLVVLTAQALYGASVGDSGAVLFGAGLDRVLTAGQSRKPLLGSGEAMPVAFTAPALTGTLLLASDGLLKYARRERVESILQRELIDDVPAQLVELVRLPSGALQDDLAVILCAPGERRNRPTTVPVRC